MAVKLLNCPFCGATLVRSAFSTRSTDYFVHPVSEEGDGTTCIIPDIRLSSKDPDRIAAWNARSESQSELLEIAAERERQKSVEGWTPEHDDEHGAGELAKAAAVYALPDNKREADGGYWAYDRRGLSQWVPTKPRLWPWGAESWKPKDRRRDLIRAAALIVAEIERLDRLSAISRAEGLALSGGAAE